MPCSHVELNIEERRILARLLHHKAKVVEIARALSRHRSSIYREIKRNWWHDTKVPEADGYWPVTAQEPAKGRRAHNRKLARHVELRDAVVNRLMAGWSPEQIAGRLKAEPKSKNRLCHETIYRYVYSEDGRNQDLARYLPERRRKRQPRRARKSRSLIFPESSAIRHRPAKVASREEFGHWEADLMNFRREHGPANVATLIERKTRFTVLFRNNDRRSKPIMARLIDVVSPLPPQTARRSLTFDRGLKFVSWRELEKGLGAQAWFCDPQAPWQKGSVENMNRRVRRYMPSDTIILTVPDRGMASLCDRLNATPRKCLSYRTPAEAFRDQLLDQGKVSH